VTSSWFFLSTLNYDARSTTHQIAVGVWSAIVGTSLRILIRTEVGQTIFLIGDDRIYNDIVTANARAIIFFIVMPNWQLNCTFNIRSTRRSITKNKQHTTLISPTIMGRVERAKNSEALRMFWHLDTDEGSFKFRPAVWSVGQSQWKTYSWTLDGFQCSKERDTEEQLNL
jgi:hypothetical protein